MLILIKNMYSVRCKLAVSNELYKLGIPYRYIDLGEVFLNQNITTNQFEILKSELLKCGLEVMDNKHAELIQAIKSSIIEMVYISKDLSKIKFSDFISNKMKMSYAPLSAIFKEVTGITIERFIIEHKIDRAKKLMLFEDLSFSQIAFDLNFSSASHLSNQFKKIAGMTPSDYVLLMHDSKLKKQLQENKPLLQENSE